MKYFCAFTNKERTISELARGFTLLGVSTGLALLVEVPDDHYMCKRLPSYKTFSKTEKDEYGAPLIIPKQIVAKTPEEMLKASVGGAIRYLSMTKPQADLADECLYTLPLEVSKKRIAAKAIVQSNPILVETILSERL